MNELYKKITVDDSFKENLNNWLFEKALDHNLLYLLAHADDGVIWGRIDKSSGLVISGDIFKEVAVQLRQHTLQQARLFGPSGELLIWFNGESFSARLIDDGQEKPDHAYEETHWLWGGGMKSQDKFTLMHEGRQGLRHAPPVENARGFHVGIKVRHYIEYDDFGQAYVANSRLIDFEKKREARWQFSRCVRKKW